MGRYLHNLRVPLKRGLDKFAFSLIPLNMFNYKLATFIELTLTCIIYSFSFSVYLAFYFGFRHSD